MKQEDIEFIVQNYKDKKPQIKEEIKDEISEEEAIEIYNGIITLLADHHLSYKCAYNIAISLMYAFMTGAAELYDFDSIP